MAGDRPVPRPWHDAPPCPRCSATVATPLATFGSYMLRGAFREDMIDRPDRLYCPACGARWEEADPKRVAWAWWSAGAYAGKEDVIEKGDSWPK